jgi:hypothetical protein
VAQEDKIRQQHRALRVLYMFNMGGLLVSLPLAFAAANAFSRAEGSRLPGVLFAIVAFVAGIAWGILFLRRLIASNLSANDLLRRLNQAAMTAGYPAYLGVASALVSSYAGVIVPFVIAGGVNVFVVNRMGRRIIDAQE